MTRYLVRRLGHALTVMLVVCTVTFAIIHLAPGGPALLSDPKLSVAERQAIEERLGLDQPLPAQYGLWLGRVVRGDLGRSFLYEAPNVRTIIARLPNTALLAGTAILVSLAVAIPIGLWCAAHPRGWADRTLSGMAFVAMAVPTFWLAIGLIFVFAVTLRVLPAGGAFTLGGGGDAVDRLRHLILPAVVLAAVTTAEIFRYTRSSARTVLSQPFVRVARAKGTRERGVRWRHALRPALLPVVTVVGIQLPRLIGGAAITETVFAWPGMGRLGVQAALGRDYPLVMAITLFVSAAVVLVNILVDLAYLWLDPRVRLERA
jgi:peptide/nickel transport system permease protein